jgi:hypothetical protein
MSDQREVLIHLRGIHIAAWIITGALLTMAWILLR